MPDDAEKLAILIPALNEEGAISSTISSIPMPAIIIVIDNGSTDQTAELATNAGATVVFEPQMGYGAACLQGIAELATIKPDIVAFLDADGADDPKMLVKMVDRLHAEPHTDIVMGARLRHLEKGAMAWHAKLANRVLVVLIRILYRVRLQDLGPMRVMRYATLLDIGMQDRGYGWSAEMVVKAIRKGYSIAEVDVPYRARIGKSKISGSVKNSLRAAFGLMGHIIRNMRA